MLFAKFDSLLDALLRDQPLWVILLTLAGLSVLAIAGVFFWERGQRWWRR